MLAFVAFDECLELDDCDFEDVGLRVFRLLLNRLDDRRENLKIFFKPDKNILSNVWKCKTREIPRTVTPEVLSNFNVCARTYTKISEFLESSNEETIEEKTLKEVRKIKLAN